MQKILRITSLILLTICFSCEDQSFIVQCSDCLAEEPITAELRADLDPEYFYQSLVQVWEGNLEDSILVDSYSANSQNFTREVTINKKYTITATYYISNVRYIAVDSATPRVKYEKSQCEEPCFFLYDRQCDLRLKYTK